MVFKRFLGLGLLNFWKLKSPTSRLRWSSSKFLCLYDKTLLNSGDWSKSGTGQWENSWTTQVHPTPSPMPTEKLYQQMMYNWKICTNWDRAHHWSTMCRLKIILPHPKTYPFCGPNSRFRKVSLIEPFYKDRLNQPEVSWTGCITEGPYNLTYIYTFQDMTCDVRAPMEKVLVCLKYILVVSSVVPESHWRINCLAIRPATPKCFLSNKLCSYLSWLCSHYAWCLHCAWCSQQLNMLKLMLA